MLLLTPKQKTAGVLKGLQEDGEAISVAQTACNEADGAVEGSVLGWGGPFTVGHDGQPASTLEAPKHPTNHLLDL